MISIDDRMAILDLGARYNYAIDTGRSKDWADTFTPDGVFDGPAGRAEGREQLIEFCDGLGEQYPGAMHFNDNHLFEVDGDLVRHKCFLSLQVPGEDGATVVPLCYEDEVVKLDEKWLFRSRCVAPLGPAAGGAA